MADLAKLVVRLELQSAQLLNELNKTNAKLQGFERRIKGFGSSVKTALGVFAGAFGLNKIVDASAEAAKNFALLENAVANAGEAAGGRSARQFSDISEQLQSVTTFSDDAIQGVQQLLLRFQSIRTDRFDEATKSVLDLATALHVDAESAAKLLGKALSDPEKGMTALAKAGVIFSDKQKKVIKDLVETGRAAEAQGIILDELAGKFGGAAEAARNNFSGALEGVKNAFDNLLEIDGGLPEATKQLNELAHILEDPATKAGADTLFSAIVVGATTAASAVGKFAQGLHLAFGGEGSSELVNIENELQDLIDKREELEKALQPGLRRETGGFFGLVTSASEAKAQLVGLNDVIAQTEKLLQSMYDNGGKRPSAKPAAGSGAEILPDITVIDGLTEAAAKARAAIEAQGKALTEALDPFAKYDAAVAQADKLLAANVISFDVWVAALGDAREDLTRFVAGMTEAVDKVQTLEESLQEFKVGNVGEIEKDLAGSLDNLPDFKKQVEEQEKELDAFAKRAAENIQDIIGDGLSTALKDGVEEGAKGALDAFVDMLERMAIEAIAADLAKKIFGTGEGGVFGSEGGGLFQKGLDWLKGLGSSGAAGAGAAGAGAGGWLSAIAGIFGGFMDQGGHGQAGVPVMIGRGAQPEMFVPDTAGEFYPAGSYGGKTEINFNIAAPSGKVSLETQQQLAARTQQALAHAQRRNG